MKKPLWLHWNIYLEILCQQLSYILNIFTAWKIGILVWNINTRKFAMQLNYTITLFQVPVKYRLIKSKSIELYSI